ncbi:MAG: PEP-CTERM sorting domain-containing protein [Burkholderiales bacterium]|nr:PEP-CTERM sorting domain-containing protein [Burkholderiales bacterium]
MRLLGNAVASAVVLAALSGAVEAQVFGPLANFDVVNNTGSTAHGFEIELEDLHSSNITDTFGGEGRGFPTTVQRYGAPSIVNYSDGVTFGVRVIYQATFDSLSSSWNVGTPTGVFNNPGDSCWTGGGIGYGPSTPCDHFGVGTNKNPTRTTYRWLTETAPNSPTLTRTVANIPAPNWNVIPAPVVVGQPPAPPVVVARIEAPPVPEGPEPQFGTPIWVKVFTTEVEQHIELEDLVANNPNVQAARSKTEIEWMLLQSDPKNAAAGVLENGAAAPVREKAEAVIRRYEFYEYTGEVNPEDNEAKPLLGDSHPSPGEIGNYLGAQNAALNLALAPIPEPETYALMAAGLLVVAGAARRRARRR